MFNVQSTIFQSMFNVQSNSKPVFLSAPLHMDTFPNTAENGGAEYVLTKKDKYVLTILDKCVLTMCNDNCPVENTE